MLSDPLLDYLLLYILLEYYEILWQKANSIMGMLIRMHKYYHKNIFLFLVMHPTFMFAIAFVMLTDYALGAIGLVIIKTVDIATKILLIEQVFIKRELSQEMSLMLLAPLHPAMPYLGLIVYPPLVYLSLV